MRRLLLLLAFGCACRGGDQTAIVFEVLAGAIDPMSLDAVVFTVKGPGLEAGGREARAPLQGLDARTFPLSLVLVKTAEGAGPFTVQVAAWGAGVWRAGAVDDRPVAFEDGAVIRRVLVLGPSLGPSLEPTLGRDGAAAEGGGALPDGAADATIVGPVAPADASTSDLATMTPTSHPDAAATRADAAAPDVPRSPPPGPDARPSGSGGSGGDSAGVCDGCDDQCVIADRLGLCVPLADGLPCRGNSGMTCRACRCVR